MLYTEQEEGEWSKPKPLSGEFVARKHDGPLAINAEGNKLLLTRNLRGKEQKEGVRFWSLYGRGKDRNGKWGRLKPCPYSVKEANRGHGCCSLDGNRIYLVSER